MKTISVCVAFLLAGLPVQQAPASPTSEVTATRVLDAAIAIVKANALQRDRIVWPEIEPKLREMVQSSTHPADAYPAIKVLLASLGDRHSFAMPPAQTTAFKTGGANNPPAEVMMLPGRVGYIRVPAYAGGDPGAAKGYVTRVHDEIAKISSMASCGWTVDLRPNGGGNMWPMLAGLKPLLGSGTLGSFEAPGRPSVTWKATAAVQVEPPASLGSLDQAWVAVLTGPKTASSGEAVAVAFRERPRSRSFGQPTAGLSTANGSFPLPDGGMLFLTASVFADRTGRQYGEKLIPDESVEWSGTIGAADDTVISAAARWLTSSSGCAR
jgi:C-terminal processing protease CtpA/Prc